MIAKKEISIAQAIINTIDQITTEKSNQKIKSEKSFFNELLSVCFKYSQNIWFYIYLSFL